jgi:hypothetical protein
MDTVGPFRDQRALVASFDIALDSVAEFVLAGDADAAQDRTGHFGEEDLDPVEPGGVGWREDKFKAPGFSGEEAAGFSRAVGRVVIEQDADQHANRIGGVEFLQEGNELVAAVALSEGVVNNAGHEVDGCREGHSSKPLVFMAALDSGMLPGLGRQIGGSGGNCLNARLFVVGEDRNGPLSFGECPHHFGRRIYLDDFGLALIERWIAAYRTLWGLTGCLFRMSWTVLGAS